jgi:hypothetical protein
MHNKHWSFNFFIFITFLKLAANSRPTTGVEMAGRTSSRPSTGANTRFVSLITITGYVSTITITNDSLVRVRIADNGSQKNSRHRKKMFFG